MKVAVIDQSDKTHMAKANVPQDFLLSLTFFLLFINDLPRNINIKHYKGISKNKNDPRPVADLYSDLSLTAQ